MYENLIRDLRYKAEFLRKANRDSSSVHNSFAETMSQAADVIEEEDMAFRQLERDYKVLCGNLPKWIPVTETLPKKPKNHPNCKLREYYFLVTLETNAVVCREYDFDNKRWPGTIRVTHWMPMPEPPKEE